MLKRLLLLIVLTLIGVSIALTLSFRRADLSVSEAAVTPLPAAQTNSGLRIAVINTADIETPEGIRVRGGDLSQAVNGPVSAILIDHPNGRFLLDAGMGRDAEAHLAGEPWTLRALTNMHLYTPAVDKLDAAGVGPLNGIILTHVHWDHVSGLADFPGVPVLLPSAEQDFIASGNEMGNLYREIDRERPIRTMTITYDNGPYGPWDRSLDLFGDGSVILVPLTGHTPGSLAVLVNLPDGSRWLFIGDLAWSQKGVQWPAERPWLPRTLADNSPQEVRDNLVLIHKLMRQHPELTVVPAHDPISQAKLPTL